MPVRKERGPYRIDSVSRRGRRGSWRDQISTVLAGQKLGINEVDIFMPYDVRYFDLEQKTLQPLDNPLGPKTVTDVSGTTSPL